MNGSVSFFYEKKFELLLSALIQHLFIGIFLVDMPTYTKVIWPINMVILGVASTGVFIEKGKWKNILRIILFFLVVALPIGLPFFGYRSSYMIFLNVIYVLFFSFIFLEIIRFLIKPGYINADIISAAACGYFLLIEINVFLLQVYFYRDSASIKGVDTHDPAVTFMDLVYFCSIILTSIGFGDITPNTYQTKLITSFFGIAGQFYSVVLVGILISKFTSKSNE